LSRGPTIKPADPAGHFSGTFFPLK